MNPYKEDDLIILTDKILKCLYSLNQSVMFARKSRECATRGIARPKILELLGMYYIDHYLHELSELYTAFYNKGDREILDRFNASEDERKKLRSVRHGAAHVTSSIDEVMKADRELHPSIKLGIFEKDLILMTKHIKLKIKPFDGERGFIERLREVFDLYPPEYSLGSVKKDLLEE